MYKRNAQGWSKHLDFTIIELISLQLAYILASYIRHHASPYRTAVYQELGAILLFLDLIVMMLFNSMHEVLKRGAYLEFAQTFKHCTAVFVLATTYMFVFKSGDVYSRIVLFLTYFLHIAIGYLTRLIWKRILLKRGSVMGQKVTMLAVLDRSTADQMIERLKTAQYDSHEIVGVVLNDREQGRSGISTENAHECEQVGGIPVVSSLEGAADYIRQKWVDSVYIDCPSTDSKIAQLMDDCYTMAVPIHYHVPAISREGGKQFTEKIADTMVITTSVNYATPLQLVLKRMMDLTGGVIGSLFALLIMAVFGPAIKKKSPGPILFKQERIGQNGKRFQIYKLRTMYMDAEERKKDLWKESRGEMFKLDFDPRIIGNEILPDGTKKTGIGEFLRKTSLDEFPQFFNVLVGQMSLVGTRPPTVDEWERYKFHHRARLACKPGITGMWQVSGRSEITDFEEVVKLDTRYITNWSMGLDIRILLKTIGTVLTGRGAM